MKNEILLLELKRMRHKVKIATEKTEIAPVAPEDEIEVIEEEDSGPEPFFQSPVNWTGPDPDPSEWESEPTTKVSIDPAKARERVKRYLSSTDPKEMAKLTPQELDSMIEYMTQEEIEAMEEKLDRYHMAESEYARGMVPGSEGMMTEEARNKGLERLRQDRPELFDPVKQEMMKDYSPSYFVYYDPIFQDDRKTKFSELMLASRGYNQVKLDQTLANQLSGLIGEHLVGKSFTISTGSPTLPKEETVTIADVDPDDQKIIFKPVGRGLKLFSSYHDFFYKTQDGQRALASLAPPNVKIPQNNPPVSEEGSAQKDPSTSGPLSRGWKNLLKILPPWAKA